MFEGVTLAGRYRLEALVGQGATGDVWRASDMTLNRVVAVKLLRLAGGDPTEAQRMIREARIASQFRHANTVTVYDLQVADGRPFVVMEFVDGESLAQVIRRRGSLDVETAADVLGQVGRGLWAAHSAGIVHRDIKPANILMTNDGVAKLADFGIARGNGDTSLTQTGQMLGTIAFMAPEVALGGQATTASDIWSLGATGFAAVQGAAPFGAVNGSATSTLLRLVSEPAPVALRAGRLQGLLSEMLEQDPSRRPSLPTVLERIAGAAGHPASVLPTTAPATNAVVPTRPSTPTRLRRGARPRAAFVVSVGAAVLLAGSAVAWSVMTNRGGGHPIAKTTSSLNGSVIGTSPSAGGTATRTSAGTTAKTSAAAVAAVAADPHTVIGSFSLGTNSKISFFRDAVTNDGKRLYALESAESGFAALPVLVVDLATKQHTSIPLTGTASDMIMAPTRPTAYVSELDSTGRIADVAVIDTDQGRVQSRIALPQRGKLTDLGIVGSLAVSADGQYLFVTEPDSVAMVSTSSESVLKYLTVRNGLGSIASSRDGSRVYVVSMYEQSVDVLRTADGAKLAALKFAIFRNGVPAQAALLSPDGKKVYAYGENDGDTTQPDTVGIVDVATNSLRKVNVPSAIGGSTMAISPSGRYLYLDGSYFTAAGELGPNTLNILDLTSFTIRKVPLDGSPYGMAVSRDGKRVYTVVGTNEVTILG